MYWFEHIYQLFIIIKRYLIHFKAKNKDALQWAIAFTAKYTNAIDSKTLQKMARLSVMQEMFVNQTYAEIFNHSLSKKEIEHNRLYFLMSSIYDDLIDNKSVSIEVLDALIQHGLQQNTINNPTLFLLVDILDQLKKEAPYPKLFKEHIDAIHQAQKESLQQFKNIPYASIVEIALKKCGYSLLLGRDLLRVPIDPFLDQSWYHLGGLIQMTDDLFDIHKDLQEGIHTTANSASSLEEIEQLYNQIWEQLIGCLKKSDLQKKQKRQFIQRIALIPAFGQLAIDNLKRFTQLDFLSNFSNIERKDLIIDMELFSNQKKLIQYSYHIAKKALYES